MLVRLRLSKTGNRAFVVKGKLIHFAQTLQHNDIWHQDCWILLIAKAVVWLMKPITGRLHTTLMEPYPKKCDL